MDGFFGEGTVTLFLYGIKLQLKWLLLCALVLLLKGFFSLLNCTFDDHQHQALNDYKEASIRIRYNENFRDRKQY